MPSILEQPAASLKVLMIVESSAAGTGRHVLDLADGLIARGVEVHVIYSPLRADRLFLDRLAEIDGLRTLALPMRTGPHPRDIAVVRAVRRYLRAYGPFDAIHGHSSKGGAVARLAAFGTGVPALYTLHGLIMMDPSLARWKWLFYLTIELMLSWRTARIIAVSPEEARAAARVGLGRWRVITIPNGIGPLKLTPRHQARRIMGVDDDALVIGFVGRLVEQKAPEVLVRAFAATAAVAPHARLAMVGAGPLDQALRDLAWRLGVADKIIWLGERDARQVFSGFDVFALSSQKEGLPYVVLEALAVGLPVVATSSAGVEILVEPGVNGAVVPPGDDRAFARALIDLAANPSRVARYAAASRARAAQLTIDAMVERTLEAYQGLAKPRTGTPEARSEGRIAPPAFPIASLGKTTPN
jgi:glycosyltransferase involved in cell wall biosynthesis